jgi:hypothetical protein
MDELRANVREAVACHFEDGEATRTHPLAFRGRGPFAVRVKLPRDVSGLQAVRALQRLGFAVVRQRGSPLQIRTARHYAHNHICPP